MNNYTRLIQIFLTVTIVMGLNTGIHADGSKIGRYISFDELVSKTPYIFSVKILKTNHVYRERRAYGETHRYIASYRFKVTIQTVYKADREFKDFIKTKNNIWIERQSLMVPGKWVLIKEKYKESISPAAVRKENTIIVYGTYISPQAVHFNNCDTLENHELLLDLQKK